MFDCFLVVSTNAIDCLERLISDMTYYVSSGTLNPTHWLTHFCTYTVWSKSSVITTDTEGVWTAIVHKVSSRWSVQRVDALSGRCTRWSVHNPPRRLRCVKMQSRDDTLILSTQRAQTNLPRLKSVQEQEGWLLSRTDRETGRQRGRQTDRQTDRQNW